MANLIYFILIVLVILAGVLFGSANQQLVELDFIFTRFELRLVDITVLFFLAGLLFGVLVSLLFHLRSRFKKRASPSSSN